MMNNSSNIVFQRTYQLREAYESIKDRAFHMLGNYRFFPTLVMFSDIERSVTFSTERLIPAASTNRPRVMLLFSNPHPYSVHQGMFLSPNTKGRENLFWPVMEYASLLPIPMEYRDPEQLADICTKAEYEGPFELIFYCYYAFPTDYPDDIRKIFGREYFSQNIEPESNDELKEIILDTSVDAVITFNKGIFNLVSNDQIERYIKRLKEGELIQSQIKGIPRHIPIFLTYPTGWRYHKNYIQFRKASLDTIRAAICGG
jgi:hypothetical protein